MNLKFLKSLKFKKTFKKENFQVYINIYWKILVGLFFAVIIGGFVFAFFVFREFNKDFYNNKDYKIEVKINKKDKIKNILNYFSMKEKKLNEVIFIDTIIDPSL